MDYDTYRMPFGKHKTRLLKEVPVHYLVSIYKGARDNVDRYPELKEYIETELSALIEVKVKIKNGVTVTVIPDPLCNKQCYVDEQEAKKALKLINQDKRTHKKPNRVYFHQACGFWHLTSEPLNKEENEEQ
jgi:uncharacterized protein (DUF3820 family)